MLVLGIGRGTSGIISLIHENRSGLLDTMFVSTDEKAVGYTRARVKVVIGKRLCGGYGADGMNDLGERAAEDAKRDIEPYLRGYKMIAVVSTLGKGTGSGATPVLSSLAESTGSFVVNFLILPSASLESLRRSVANHTRHTLLRRGFNVVTIDQDRFREIHGEEPFSTTFHRLDALLSGVILALSDVIFGTARRRVSISDLKSLFNEGKEGSLFIYGGDPGNPRDSASRFLRCGLLKRDPKTAKGVLLNLVTPKNIPERRTQPMIDEIFQQIGGGKSIFIGTLAEPEDSDLVDMIGIITGMDDGSVNLADLCKKQETGISRVRENHQYSDRWDIPMIR